MNEQTILVVDDSPVMRQTLASILKMSGYQVLEADDGASALRTVNSAETIDLILVDINMPVLGGLPFIAAARKMPKLRDAPILVVTVESRSHLMERAKAAGATGWITKPVDSARLLEAITHLLG